MEQKMTKQLQIFLLNILLILGISCTTETEITDIPDSKANITIVIEQNLDTAVKNMKSA